MRRSLLNHSFYSVVGRERMYTARFWLSEKTGLLKEKWKVFLKISLPMERKMVGEI